MSPDDKTFAPILSHFHLRSLVNHRLLAGVWIPVLLCGFVLTSCGAASQASPPHNPATGPTVTAIPTAFAASDIVVNKPVASTGCGKNSSIAPGTTANVVIAAHPATARGNATRSYLVHVPGGYKTNQPQAVVLVFHGHGGDAAGAESSFAFSTLADRRDFIAVYPQGLLDDDGLPFWASIGPIDYGIDDALFVSDMVTTLQMNWCIDPARIYATGFSNGGGMSGFLACKLAMRIAAFAPVSGNYYDLPDGCHPGRAVPILEIHGTADHVVPYAGISPNENPVWHLPSIPQWLQDWATRDGCVQGPITFLRQPSVTGERWQRCQANAMVVHYRMEGADHSLPAAIGGQSTAEVMWDFFQAHPLPA